MFKVHKRQENKTADHYIFSSLISLILKIKHDCSVALVEGVTDGGMASADKNQREIEKVTGLLEGHPSHRPFQPTRHPSCYFDPTLIVIF